MPAAPFFTARLIDECNDALDRIGAVADLLALAGGVADSRPPRPGTVSAASTLIESEALRLRGLLGESQQATNPMNTSDPRPDKQPSATKPDPDFEPHCWEWDRWERDAIERGISKEMAGIGRAVIREAGQHAWCRQLRCLCSEEVLEELLLRSPDLAKRLCAVLIETDGLRFALAEDDPENCEIYELAGFDESSNW